MPPYYSYVYSSTYYGSNEGAVSGTSLFVLAPYIEQDNVFKASYGPLVYTYSYKQTYNGVTTTYGPTTTNLIGNGYQASRVKGKIKSFYSKLDPTAEMVESPASYHPNVSVFGSVYYYGANMTSYPGGVYRYGLNLEKMTDGTSNTLMWAEGYSQCKTSQYQDYSAYYGKGSYYKYDYNYTRVWNYDPLNYSYEYTYKYQAPGNGQPYVYEYQYTGFIYPYFSAYGIRDTKNGGTSTVPFEVKPPNGQCTYTGAQAMTSGGLVTALCDASVRIISPSISLTTWTAAGTPQGGEVLGSNW
jgi:hypothetical protein